MQHESITSDESNENQSGWPFSAAPGISLDFFRAH